MTTKKLKLQGLIFTRYDDYSKRLASGWVQQMLIDELKTEGYEIEPKYFSRCLGIARKRKQATQALMIAPEKTQIQPGPVVAPAAKPQPKRQDTSKFTMEVLSDERLF